MVTITTRSNTLTILCDGFHVTKGKPVLTKASSVKSAVSTFIEDIVKEVNRQPKSKQKRFLRTLQKTILLILPMQIAMKTHAQASGFPILDSRQQSELFPSEIREILMELIFAAGALAVALAMLCLIIAGIYKMMNQSEKAKSWTTNIIIGLGQVLLAPIVILVLVTLASLVFKNVPGLERFF